MKALSLIQPWAWAVAHGGKRLENRVWKWLRHGLPAIRKHVAKGERIAIHASSTTPRECDIEGVARALGIARYDFMAMHQEALTPGVITATCTIDDVLRTSTVTERIDPNVWPLLQEDRERYVASLPFADGAVQIANWWLGPYALVLGDVKVVPDPVHARGRQMFWTLPWGIPTAPYDRLVALGVA